MIRLIPARCRHIQIISLFSWGHLAFAQNYTFHIGSYTDPDVLAHQPRSQKTGAGISTLQFNPESGFSKKRREYPVLNPAVLVRHPAQPIVYAISENIDRNGSITAFDEQPDGRLRKRSDYHASGSSTCYLAIDPIRERGVITNYWDGIVEVAAVWQSGDFGQTQQSFQQHLRQNFRQVTDRQDHWQNRQVGPHAHSVGFWDNWVFIPDLGENAIFQYRWTDRGQLDQEAVIELHAGAGPRHMAFHPNLPVVYISTELDSSVKTMDLDADQPEVRKPRMHLRAEQSTLALEVDTNKKNYVSQIALTPDARFLYVSNRGDDSLAIFAVNQKTGDLQFRGTQSTFGKFPRHFAISPDGKVLIVANQDSDMLVAYSINQSSGALKALAGAEVAAPNFILFTSAASY